MRVSPLKDECARQGALFSERFGCEIVTRVHDMQTEYNAIRQTAGITDFSFMQKFRVPEEEGLDCLDGLVAGNVAKIRFGRVLHTFLPDDEGLLVADCYIANNDDELIVLCESIADDTVIRSRFAGSGCDTMEDLTDSHVVIGIDGFKAWEVVRSVFGVQILGLPYLSIEQYSFNDVPVRLFRSGKTSEFGYLVMAPKEIASDLFNTLHGLATELGGCLCGADIHGELRLEGRFFNIFAEGGMVRDPLQLGLQWMIDFDKDQFPGKSAIMSRRSAGLQKKIIGIQAPPSVSLEKGGQLFDGTTPVGEIQATCFSYTLHTGIGLALLDIDVAFSGLTFNYSVPGGPEIATISMPPIVPKSLTVKLDEL
jgi:glycine cleavage system aminomethyltransferase T